MISLINALKNQANCTPNKTAIIHAKGKCSYKELWFKVEEKVNQLAPLNIQRLAIHSPNSLDWIVTDLAALVLDIAVVPIPLFFSDEQKSFLLQDSKVDTLICDQQLHNSVVPDDAQKIITTDDNSVYSLNDILFESFPQVSKITYTSGSTGHPKGVCLSASHIESVTRSLAEALGNGLGNHMCLIPFSTLLENIAGIYVPLISGRAIVVNLPEQFGLLSNNQFNTQLFCDAVEKYRITSAILFPQILMELVKSADISKLSTLEFLAVGGGKVSGNLLDQAKQLGLPAFEGYGLSECASVVALNTPKNNKIGSVGKPLSHANVSISNDGEVLVAESVMQGYLHQPLHEQIIHTGDLGYIDEQGYLFIQGRIKNVIISSFGRNISPEWVESELLQHPSIRQIAILGDGLPHLSAILYSSSNITDSTIQEAIDQTNSSLPDYARVHFWYRLDTPFTVENGLLTGNGKLSRSHVKQQFQHLLDSQEAS